MEALKAIAREKTGTTSARQLRLEGLIPGIIYGHGLDNVPFAVSSRDIMQILTHGEQLVKMSIDGKDDNYLIKDVQRDAFDNEVIHLDFARVNLDETVEVTVQLAFKGTAKGESAGGVLSHGANSIVISCPVVKIPEEVVVHIDELGVGEALHVSDIEADGFEIITDAETMIISCNVLAEEVEEDGDEEAASDEPEVIGKGKDEEDSEE